MQRLIKHGLVFNFFQRGEWVRTTPTARENMAKDPIGKRRMMVLGPYRPLVLGEPLRVIRTITPDSSCPYGGDCSNAIIELENGSSVMNLFDAESFMPAWVTDDQYENWKARVAIK